MFPGRAVTTKAAWHTRVQVFTWTAAAFPSTPLLFLCVSLTPAAARAFPDGWEAPVLGQGRGRRARDTQPLPSPPALTPSCSHVIGSPGRTCLHPSDDHRATEGTPTTPPHILSHVPPPPAPVSSRPRTVQPQVVSTLTLGRWGNCRSRRTGLTANLPARIFFRGPSPPTLAECF